MTREQRLVLTIAVLASFVSFLDGTIVNVALPAIVRELGGGIRSKFSFRIFLATVPLSDPR